MVSTNASALAGLTDAHPEVRESVIEAVRPLLLRVLQSGGQRACASPTIPSLAFDSESRSSWVIGMTSRLGEALARLAGATAATPGCGPPS